MAAENDQQGPPRATCLSLEENATDGEPMGQVDALVVPRFAGISTFARLPLLHEGSQAAWDVAIVGAPFDAGCSYRSGARMGPSSVRAASKLLRSFNPAQNVQPFAQQQVVDAGDIPCTPFDIPRAVDEIDKVTSRLLSANDGRGRVVCIGGDHTISLGLLRAARRRFGPVALLHADSHLDTFGSYFQCDLTHGNVFRNAAQEGLMIENSSVHLGVRGSLYSPQDVVDDGELGFTIIRCDDIETDGITGIVERIKRRIGDLPLYISIDIDVLDPAFAPATGTPECGGFSTRELFNILRGLAGHPIVGCDVVEVSPAYDHAEITSLAAATLVYELTCLLAQAPLPPKPSSE